MPIINVPCMTEGCEKKLSIASENVNFFLTGCEQFGQTAVALYECTYCNKSSSIDLDHQKVAELFESRVKFEGQVTADPLPTSVAAYDRSNTAFRVLRAIRDAEPDELYDLIVGESA